ncbi:hypothetical protein HZS_7860 [Henneguya salminicola]|nr:hypothetical protein HZS_7860 [Henneguya salminicola]
MYKKYARFCANAFKFKHIKRFNSQSRFEGFSGQDWSETGLMAALHSFNTLRVPWIVQKLNPSSEFDFKNSLKNYRILDVGCGAGILATVYFIAYIIKALCLQGADVVGIDESESSITIAKKRAQVLYPELKNKRLKFEKITPDEMEFNSSEKFDAVVASEVIEHVPNAPQFIYNCCNLTKVGGMIFFTTINRTYLSLAFAKFIAEYVLRVVPSGIHSWNKFMVLKILKHLAQFIILLRTNGRGWTTRALITCYVHEKLMNPPCMNQSILFPGCIDVSINRVIEGFHE